jgi:type VI protein secretion system component VasK
MQSANYLDNSLELECQKKKYESEFASYRPDFRGRNPNEVPSTAKTHICFIILLFPSVIFGVGVFAPALIWATRDNDSFTYTWLALLIATVVFLVVVSFMGSYNQNKREREYISAKTKQLEEIKVIIKKENDEAERVLLSGGK